MFENGRKTHHRPADGSGIHSETKPVFPTGVGDLLFGGEVRLNDADSAVAAFGQQTLETRVVLPLLLRIRGQGNLFGSAVLLHTLRDLLKRDLNSIHVIRPHNTPDHKPVSPATTVQNTWNNGSVQARQYGRRY